MSNDVDVTTERVVDCRRTVPASFSNAVKRRAQALAALSDAREDQRQRRLRKSKQYPSYPGIARGRALKGLYKRASCLTDSES